MGRFLNPGNKAFQKTLKSEIYVDKTMLLAYTNKVIGSDMACICNSRPRRFGKSMAANMLTAYYSRECDSHEIFDKLKIAEADSYEKKMNQYDTIFVNMQEFLSCSQTMKDMLDLLKQKILHDVLREYSHISYFDRTDMVGCLDDVFVETQRPFVVIIDEWDCIFREYRNDYQAQRQYLDFLRDWLKDKAISAWPT